MKTLTCILVCLSASFAYADQAYSESRQDLIEIAAAEATPNSEVIRVIDLMPRPKVAFVEYGCGRDARWCQAAARRWGCKAYGIELDRARALEARRQVRLAKLDHLVTIIEDDATTVNVDADVGAAYLYHDVLVKLRPRAEKLQAFASYMHRPQGISASQTGDSWIYVKPAQAQMQQSMQQQRVAIYAGQQYTAPVCNNPRCSMCNNIRAQLGQ